MLLCTLCSQPARGHESSVAMFVMASDHMICSHCQRRVDRFCCMFAVKPFLSKAVVHGQATGILWASNWYPMCMPLHACPTGLLDHGTDFAMPSSLRMSWMECPRNTVRRAAKESLSCIRLIKCSDTITGVMSSSSSAAWLLSMLSNKDSSTKLSSACAQVKLSNTCADSCVACEQKICIAILLFSLRIKGSHIRLVNQPVMCQAACSPAKTRSLL